MQLTDEEKQLIGRALALAEKRMTYCGSVIDCPQAVREFLRLLLCNEEREVFGCVWLTSKHDVIGTQELFQGSIDSASVYPREVVKAALANNAAAVIYYHNHPSGNPEPSRADTELTKRLKTALELVEVRTLDHLVVGSSVTSMAELGWI